VIEFIRQHPDAHPPGFEDPFVTLLAQYGPDGWLCQWVPEGAPPLWRSEAGQPIFSWVPEVSPSVWGSAARHSEQVGRRIPGWTWRGRRSCSSGGSGCIG
jgi:hypothetical protein